MKAHVRFCAAVVMLSLLTGCQIKPDAPTLWQSLAIPQTADRLRANVVNRRGRLPGLEKKPMLRSIADPANLVPEAPKVIAVAAKVKQSEDQAAQKIKAIRYLAKIGCDCYDFDNSITQAFVAALEDCTEKVRLAAAKALADAAKDESCDECKQRGCCSVAVRKKLSELAYKTDDDGYFAEPSERVRKAAELALSRCGGAPIEPDPDQPRIPADPDRPRPPADASVENETDIEAAIRTAENRHFQNEPEPFQPVPQTSDVVDEESGDADEVSAAADFTVPQVESAPSVVPQDDGQPTDGGIDQGR